MDISKKVMREMVKRGLGGRETREECALSGRGADRGAKRSVSVPVKMRAIVEERATRETWVAAEVMGVCEWGGERVLIIVPS